MATGKFGVLFAVVLVVALVAPPGVESSSGTSKKAYSGKATESNWRLRRGDNGGTTCGVCTALVGLSSQLAEIHNETIVNSLQRLCSYLPGEFQDTCRIFLKLATPVLVEMFFSDYVTPDVACQLLNFCYTEPGYPSCNLFPLPKMGMEKAVYRAREKLPKMYQQGKRIDLDVDCADLPIFKQLCELIETRFGDDHLPLVDIDLDKFSIYRTLRGSYWRGKDCNDLLSSYHPGIKPVKDDLVLDSDCNGIFGVDLIDFKPYEQTLCSKTPHMGTILLGDSAGAHFHIPKEWLTASELSLEAFEDVAMIVANEIDWPMLSAVTGYMNTTWPVEQGPTNSLYLRLRELNHCNHRDFQNLAVNGADCNSMNDTIQYGISRDQKRDHPAMVIYSLVGNDVCNGHNDTISHMTTPAEMKANFLSTLQYLDTVLPNGSHVIATGLADGRILYNTLQNRIHPIGEWHRDVTYPDVYEYLNCLGVSPCNGWLTRNETLRNLTSERAAELSRVIEDVTSSYTYEHFDLHYMEYDIERAVEKWMKMGGKPWEMIEPVDGFHPSQVGMYLMSEILWEELNDIIPEVIKSLANPNNERIRAIFGDQGGY